MKSKVDPLPRSLCTNDKIVFLPRLYSIISRACRVRQARHGVELIAPQPGGAGTTDSTPTLCVRDDEFTVQLVPSQPPSTCPCGVTALQTRLRDDPEEGPIALLVMPTPACAACPRRGWCPQSTLNAQETLVMVALQENLPVHRRAAEQEDAFRDRYRARAGIEGTNSELKRGQGLGDLRVRGAARMALAVFMKLTACNMKRALKYWGTQAKKSLATGAICRKSARYRVVDGIYAVGAVQNGLMPAVMLSRPLPSHQYAAA